MVANDLLAARPAYAPRLIGALLLLSVACVLTVMSESSLSVDTQIRWGAVALTAFCCGLLALMAVAARHDGLGLVGWRIGPWSLAWGALAFGIATLSWIGWQNGTPAEILPASILRALCMLAVALAMFTLGYCAGPHRLAAVHARRLTHALQGRFTDEIRSPAVPWMLLGVGVMAQLGFAVLNGRLGYVGDAASSVTTTSGYSQYLAVAGECVSLAVMAAAFRAYRLNAPAAWLALGVIFAAAIAVGAVAGGKESFVVAILAVIIPHTIIRRRLPLGAVAAAVLVFLLVVIPFNQAYRSSVRGTVTLSTSEAVANAPAIASQVLASDFTTSVLGQSADYLADRIRTIDTPAIVMQRTPNELPYASPGQLLIAPVIDLIPRILWPGKPVLTPGYQVSQEYYQLPADVYTSSAVTPEADLYQHGGWLPLIAGMLLLGYLIRIIDDVADLRQGIHGAFLILLLLPEFVLAESDYTELLAGIPGMILLWLAVVATAFTRRSPNRRPR